MNCDHKVHKRKNTLMLPGSQVDGPIIKVDRFIKSMKRMNSFHKNDLWPIIKVDGSTSGQVHNLIHKWMDP